MTALHIVEFADITNTGRVRRNNEDSYIVEPPLFVLADGMGGAQAGEVASRLTIEAFAGFPDNGGAEERLRGAISEANRRVVERGRNDPKTAGMGSTVTAALVDGECVAFGHVGDSRAYLLRRGQFQQISRDHSLVGELVRQGRITVEEAGSHPQRSVITRALGATDDVDVDTWRIEAEDGDLYLLCSDGLTDMVDDAAIAAAVTQDRPLRAILEQLVKQALDAGGDDNITVVAFRVGTGEAAPGRVDEATVERQRPPVDPDTLTEADRVPPIDAPLAPLPPASQRTPVTSIQPAIKRTHILPEDFDQPPQRRSIVKPLVILLIIAILAAAAVIGSIVGLRRAHFIGIDPATGRVAVYEGVPFELTADHTLYRKIYTSPTLYAAQLTAKRRHDLFDHELQSRADAVAEVKALEQDQP
jgi:serine/threonine protein phosphatase PrpC